MRRIFILLDLRVMNTPPVLMSHWATITPCEVGRIVHRSLNLSYFILLDLMK